MRLISGRVIRSAAKLALFYAAVVILEIVVLALVGREGFPTAPEIGETAAKLGMPFAVAFVLLALARRWGFVALWLILVAFWIYLGRFGGIWSLYPTLLTSWSVLALPLWMIGQAGIPSRSSTPLRLGPIRISASAVLLACWAALLVISHVPAVIDVAYSYRFANLSRRVWQGAPFVLSAYATWHVWRGTSSPAAAEARPVALE